MQVMTNFNSTEYFKTALMAIMSTIYFFLIHFWKEWRAYVQKEFLLNFYIQQCKKHFSNMYSYLKWKIWLINFAWSIMANWGLICINTIPSKKKKRGKNWCFSEQFFVLKTVCSKK